ncbi:MAG TPA: helix-turn-helix domain-containing protein [Anaerolineae bacterium]|nr:helix-turn-helix domain-containing protein [Anaerolineae bacterium]
MQRAKISKRLYSIPEAAIYLGRSVWGIREMVWANKLPCIKDGRRVLLDIQDMNKWIEQNKTNFSY